MNQVSEINRTYPYYGQLDNVNWSIPGANKGMKRLVVKFVAPGEGVVVRGTLSHPRGKYSKRWSEANFKVIDFKE